MNDYNEIHIIRFYNHLYYFLSIVYDIFLNNNCMVEYLATKPSPPSDSPVEV